MSIGETLKQLRIDKGLTQSQVCELSGQTGLTYIENDINMPTIAQFIRLLNIYDKKIESNIEPDVFDSIVENNNYKDLCLALWEQRKKAGLSIEELSKRSGISDGAISNYENNKVKQIRLNTLFSLNEPLKLEIKIKDK